MNSSKPASIKEAVANGWLRVALCQINTVVGDIAGNQTKILAALEQAEAANCALAVFPELAICGYPPEDLLLKRRFIADCAAAVEAIAENTASNSCFAIVGYPQQRPDDELVRGQPQLYNAAAVCGDGAIHAVVHKAHLPNYAVFDEHRYFAAGQPHQAIDIHDVRVGVSICEDLWVDDGAIRQIARSGSEIIININASPYHISKWDSRQSILEKRCQEHAQPFVYVNLVGGQDELVFDGMSAVFDATGELRARAPQFSEATLVVDVPIPALQPRQMPGTQAAGSAGPDAPSEPAESAPKRSKTKASLEFLGLVSSQSEDDPAQMSHSSEAMSATTAAQSAAQPTTATATNPAASQSAAVSQSVSTEAPLIAPKLEALAEIYEALKLGVKDYTSKNGFDRVCIGLSGGIDSSLVAAIAADALGAAQVHGVLMPSRYSSEHSVADAKQLCANLGLDYSIVPIEPAHSALLGMLDDHLDDLSAGLTEENLQSRIRGIVLMAFANARGWLNLTTGNKSESAVGYSTLYGDTAGAFAVIKDVWKQQVYALAQYRNQLASSQTGSTQPTIPQNVLSKPPSAELHPGQRDDATLPPYETLDPLLFALVEQDMTAQDLLIGGYDPQMITQIARLVDLAEYKRRQNPPGIRITKKAFGKDRRMPITHGYTGITDPELDPTGL